MIRALRLLTHDPEVDYFDYVRAVKADPAARMVKLADLEHNAGRDPSRRKSFCQRGNSVCAGGKNIGKQKRYYWKEGEIFP